MLYISEDTGATTLPAKASTPPAGPVGPVDSGSSAHSDSALGTPPTGGPPGPPIGPKGPTTKGSGAIISIDMHAVLGFVFGAMTIVYYSLHRDEC